MGAGERWEGRAPLPSGYLPGPSLQPSRQPTTGENTAWQSVTPGIEVPSHLLGRWTAFSCCSRLVWGSHLGTTP